MHQKEGQKEDQEESQGSASSMRLGSKSALNFPVTYLQKAGVIVQKTVTTTGVYVHKLIQILSTFIRGTTFFKLSFRCINLMFFIMMAEMQYYVFYNHNDLSQKNGHWK